MYSLISTQSGPLSGGRPVNCRLCEYQVCISGDQSSCVQAAEWRVLQGAALWLQRRAPLMSGAAVLQSSNQMASKSGSPYFCQCSGLNEILAEAGFVY